MTFNRRTGWITPTVPTTKMPTVGPKHPQITAWEISTVLLICVLLLAVFAVVVQKMRLRRRQGRGETENLLRGEDNGAFCMTAV